MQKEALGHLEAETTVLPFLIGSTKEKNSGLFKTELMFVCSQIDRGQR